MTHTIEAARSSSPRLLARIAGWMYLAIIVFGGFGFFSGSEMTVAGDVPTTAANILASEQLWRLGFVALLIMLAADVVVAVLFYVLFRPVNKTLALLGCAFRLVMAAILGVVFIARFAPVLFLQDAASASAFETAQIQATAYVSLRLFNRGFDVGLIFFGFDCLIIGWLIFKSTFLPRILGAGLAIAGLCYLVNSFVSLVFPMLDLPFDILLPAFVAELGLTLWLIVVGVNPEKWETQAGAGALST